MPNMYRVPFVWQGWSGAPGYTTLFFDDSTGTAQQAVDITRAFLNTCAGTSQVMLPTGITINGPSAVDTIEPGTGSLVNSTPVSQPAVIVGAGTGAYAAAAGACVSWLTSAIVNGHRVRGRTFLVPLSVSAFDTSGTLSSTLITAINSAVTTLLAASPELLVWRRPVSQAAGGGGTHPVLVGKVTDKAAVLTSRRD